MKQYLKKWYFVAICFILAMLCCCLSGCGEPKQSTQPGDFGHYIYAKDPDNVVEWRVKGMYINDSLVVLGNLRYVNHKYPIMNINTGEIIDYYEIKSNN